MSKCLYCTLCKRSVRGGLCSEPINTSCWKYFSFYSLHFVSKSAAFETASGLQTFCQDNKTTAAFASTQAYLVLAEKSVLQFSVIDFTQDVEMWNVTRTCISSGSQSGDLYVFMCPYDASRGTELTNQRVTCLCLTVIGWHIRRRWRVHNKIKTKQHLCQAAPPRTTPATNTKTITTVLTNHPETLCAPHFIIIAAFVTCAAAAHKPASKNTNDCRNWLCVTRPLLLLQLH